MQSFCKNQIGVNCEINSYIQQSLKDVEINNKLKHQYPVARWKHAAVIHDNYLYIMGGYSWTNTLKDLWRLNLDILNKLMFDKFQLVGNWNSVNSLDENLNLWEDLSNFTGSISPLQSHTIVAYGNRLFIFGGAFTYDIRNCPFWIYDIERKIMCKWKTFEQNPELPMPRRNHSCSVYRNSMVLFGGFGDVRGSLSDLWTFDFVSDKWDLLWSGANYNKYSKNLSIKYGPRGRHDHRSVVYKNYLLIFGGMSGLEMCNDLWRWSFDECQWTKLIYKGDHTDLSYITDAKKNNYWLMFGINGVKKKTEKLIYSFSQNKWTTETYQIPEFHPFSTLLVFSKNYDKYVIDREKPNYKHRHNRVYPTSNLSPYSPYSNIDIINLEETSKDTSAVVHKSLENYSRLESFNTISRETVFTDLTDSTHCETTFINASPENEMPVEFCNRELLIIVGNNIERASFDYHLNIQLLYL